MTQGLVVCSSTIKRNSALSCQPLALNGKELSEPGMPLSPPVSSMCVGWASFVYNLLEELVDLCNKLLHLFSPSCCAPTRKTSFDTVVLYFHKCRNQLDNRCISQEYKA